MDYTINVRGRLMDLSQPQVMGILNVTPDSFYEGSRCETEQQIAGRATEMVSQGAAIIDVGACSTRPGGERVDEAEEMRRLKCALAVVRRVVPDAVVSVDTFRPDVARMAVEEYGADMVNDVGDEQSLDAGVRRPMFRMVSRLRVPYVLMSVQSTMRDMLMTFADEVQQLRDLGQKDIILDPGFGFGKTLEQNYEVLRQLECLQVMQLPLLAGVSRKSMINRVLGTSPTEALNGTTVLHTVALMRGASILRAHDVREAVECVRLFGHCKQ